MSELVKLSGDPNDSRPVVELSLMTCMSCDWTSGDPEEIAIGPLAEKQRQHFLETGHREAWSYTIQRGRARIVF